MVLAPRFRMGPPPWSFAADADDCIMVRIHRDPPNTSVWRDVRALMANSPRTVWHRASACHGLEAKPHRTTGSTARANQGNVAVTIDIGGRYSQTRIHEVPLTAAERQARSRAKLRQQSSPPPTAPAQRLPPRPRRWAAAIATLIGLQDEYRAWLDNLPDNPEGSRLADKLQAIAALDLEELQAIDPPRGYGRD